MEFEKLLAEASQRFGIEPGYWDIAGQWHDASPELTRGLLESLGLAAADPEKLADELAEQEWAEWNRVGAPVAVVTAAAGGVETEVRLPVERAGSWLEAEIELEQGERRVLSIHLGGAETVEARTLRGREFVRKRIRLEGAFPLGYHNICWRGEGVPAQLTRLIVAPGRAWLPPALARGERRAGLAVSLYGVRSERTWGCGDFTALRALVDWVVERVGGSYIALNPLQAIHNRQPFNTSPYLPNSVFYRNLIYLDIDDMEDVARCPVAQTLRHDAETLAEIRALNDADLVEYERVAVLKRQFLRLAFDRFLREEYGPRTGRGQAFERWVEGEGELLRLFALYSALDEYLHSQKPGVWIWTDWPREYRDPESEAVKRFAAAHPDEIRFHQYVQWQLDDQARRTQEYARSRGMEIGLFHDLPLAVDRFGADLWAHRRFYVSGCRVGSPPDSFAPEGQDWSFPPPNIGAHRNDGYRFFAESIRRSARHGGALRIDHVMRLFRLYWIAEGFDARQGTYVRDHYEDLLRVLALESVRNQVLIVGEDLGTVEPWMREALERFGILSYRLFYFEKDGDRFKASREYPVQALVSSTTHDLPTLAGFWAGRDITTRYELGLLGDAASAERARAERRRDKRQMFRALMEEGLLPAGYPEAAADGPVLSGELHNAVTGFLASTPCLLMTLNQEDLTKEMDQQNVPGTTWQYPNWRRKMRFRVGELWTDPQIGDFARMMRAWLERTGRRGAGHAGR